MKPLDHQVQQSVAELTQLLILNELSKLKDLSLSELVFQGGTSVALAWKSPRFSEDLDFVALKTLDFSSMMKKVTKGVEEGLQLSYPGAKVSLKERISEDNPNAMFESRIELPDIMGKVMVKSEFWRVSQQQIKDYQGETVFLAARGKIHPSLGPALGVATPSQIIADKILAVGLRDRLKWRDLFDVWFLRHQMDHRIEDPKALSKKVLTTLNMYDKDLETLTTQLDEFIQMPNNVILKAADEGLKRWLPEHLWERLYPAKVQEMIDDTKRICAEVNEHLKGKQVKNEKKNTVKATV